MGQSGYTCVRHVFGWLNLIIWISGCLLVSGGVWLRVQYPGQSTLLPHRDGVGLDSFLIGIGAICFLVAFLGCCGSMMQSRCLLVTYFSLVVMLLCGEFVAASLAFVYREPINRHMRSQLRHAIKIHYNTSADNNLMLIWDHVQYELHCCGVDSYEDYRQIDAWPDSRIVPDSCCRTGERSASCGTSGDVSRWWPDGCATKLSLWLTERLHYLAIIGFLIAFIQLFGLISSMVLCCTVRHKRGSRTYQSYQPAS
ncbi:tetraspanin-9-like isoform X2 [Arctopsyche grandis]|uniref:tetraspanin-9-like isoform X2 n=1 Tax=Arctopsyche grandis TaxID=121162 RepID=UPI00406D9726